MDSGPSRSNRPNVRVHRYQMRDDMAGFVELIEFVVERIEAAAAGNNNNNNTESKFEKKNISTRDIKIKRPKKHKRTNLI